MWLYGLVSLINENDNYCLIKPDKSNLSFECELSTLEQHIGVKDKNEKEIYKKDIVRVDGKRELFTVVWVCDTARFGLQGKEEILYFEFEIESRIEVIGNVYENADLLKEAGNE